MQVPAEFTTQWYLTVVPKSSPQFAAGASAYTQIAGPSLKRCQDAFPLVRLHPVAPHAARPGRAAALARRTEVALECERVGAAPAISTSG